jgi:hypothetical protein
VGFFRSCVKVVDVLTKHLDRTKSSVGQYLGTVCGGPHDVASNLLYKLSIRYFAGAVYTKRKDDDMPIPLSLLLRGNVLLCVAELCTALLRVEVVIPGSVLAMYCTLTWALVI